MAQTFLDFDGEPLGLVFDAAKQARDVQVTRNKICTRMDKLYHGVLDMTKRDPRRANVFLPKPFQVVETIVPRHIKANHGIRPFIPIEARRKDEFGYIADLQASLIDDYLEKSQFLAKRILQTKIAVVQGVAFMDAVPDYDMVSDPFAVYDETGQLVQVISRMVPRFRLKLQVWAPWEVLVDPRAAGLEEKGQCRYIVKIQLTSRRALKKMYERNPDGFPGLDEAALYNRRSGASTELSGHVGLQMLRELGLPEPQSDEDTEVLLRYESEERYIDVLGGDVVIRDIPNPYKHGQINLSRLIHTQRPSTQDQFWGMGALKPAEVMFHIRNDLMNNMLDNAHAQNQYRIYYDILQDPKNFTTSPGALIGIDRKSGEKISDYFYESPGQPLNRDFYMLPEVIDNETDRTTGVYDMTRGETPEKTTTATQDVLRRDAGDVRLETGVLQDEIFLADFAHKVIETVAQYVGIQDVIEILGQEKAMRMYMPTSTGPMLMTNPAEIPGSFNLKFKGSDRVGEEVLKQQMAQETVETLLTFPTTRPDELQKIYMERTKYTKDEMDRVVRPMQEVIQEQMMMQEQEAKQEMAKSEREHEQQMELEALKQKARKADKSKPKGKAAA